MNDTKLGIVPPNDAKRDAVHVAVIPVVAGETLYRGSRVKLEGGKAFLAKKDDPSIGVVDPFLDVEVLGIGVSFYLCLNPGSITSLRHVWTHPDLNAEGGSTASEMWIRDFIKGRQVYRAYHPKLARDTKCESSYCTSEEDCYCNVDIPYEYFIQTCDHHGQFTFNTDYHGENADELKMHLENVLGHPLDKFYAGCSC